MVTGTRVTTLVICVMSFSMRRREGSVYLSFTTAMPIASAFRSQAFSSRTVLVVLASVPGATP